MMCVISALVIVALDNHGSMVLRDLKAYFISRCKLGLCNVHHMDFFLTRE